MSLVTVGSGRCWQYSHNVGMRQTTGQGFSQPIGVAVGKDGAVFVASRGNPRITKATLNHEYLTEFGQREFTYLTAVALDQDDNVYASDEWLHRIFIFDSDGNLIESWGEAGEEEGQLYGPSGLAFDSNNNLVVANSRNSRIQKFTKQGQYLSSFGKKGNGGADLDMPWGIAIDNGDAVYVADWNNHRVQKYSPDGAHLLSFGSGKPAGVALDGSTLYSHATERDIGVSPDSLNHPSGVAVDGDGDVYVVDWMNERVVIFNPDADPVACLRGDAYDLSKWAQSTVDANPDMAMARRRVKNPEIQNYFRMPVGCLFDQGTNRLIVCDTQMCRLQIYVKDKNYLEPQFNL